MGPRGTLFGFRFMRIKQAVTSQIGTTGASCAGATVLQRRDKSLCAMVIEVFHGAGCYKPEWDVRDHTRQPKRIQGQGLRTARGRAGSAMHSIEATWQVLEGEFSR